jgi:hypothetical protein
MSVDTPVSTLVKQIASNHQNRRNNRTKKKKETWGDGRVLSFEHTKKKREQAWYVIFRRELRDTPDK